MGTEEVGDKVEQEGRDTERKWEADGGTEERVGEMEMWVSKGGSGNMRAEWE